VCKLLKIFSFILCFNQLYSSVVDKIGINNNFNFVSRADTEKILSEWINAFLGEKHIKNAKIEDYTGKRSRKLNFIDSATLYVLTYKTAGPIKRKRIALERMYLSCPDIRLIEFILWDLALIYEEIEEYQLASDAFGQFRKLFPGSKQYYVARVKEIYNAYRIIPSYECDQSVTEKLVAICRDYLIDFSKDHDGWNEVYEILFHLYQNLILRDVMIVTHYLTKHSYIGTTEVFLAILQRLYLMSCMLQEMITFDDNFLQSKKNHIIYQLLEEIDLLFVTYDIPIELEDFIEEHEKKTGLVEKRYREIKKSVATLIKKIQEHALRLTVK